MASQALAKHYQAKMSSLAMICKNSSNIDTISSIANSLQDMKKVSLSFSLIAYAKLDTQKKKIEHSP